MEVCVDQQGGLSIPGPPLRAEVREPLRRAEALIATEPTRAQLHMLLDAALDLTELIASGSDPEEAAIAARVVQKLLHCGFGPLVNRLMVPWHPTDAHEEARRDDRTQAEIRYDMARGLILLPSLMRDADRNLLAGALRALDSRTDDVPELFVREPKKGRGANPRAAEHAEEEAWQWIWRLHDRTGERIGRLKMRVASAAGVTPEAVEKWREAWVRRDGKDVVRSVRGLAVARWWSSDGEIIDDPDPAASLHEIAEDWKAARMPAKARRRPSRPK
jgi:hypothetical protein